MRQDDWQERRAHAAGLSDQELRERFWQITNDVVTPLVALARTHTSPSIERSVLMRMGFSSAEAKVIVDRCIDRGLLGKGAGNVVYRLARKTGKDIRTCGLELAQGMHLESLDTLFGFKGGRQ